MIETCDRHQTARAQARITLPSGGVLFACGHCARTWSIDGEYGIEYAGAS